jgi:hypothetical protein
MTDSENEKQWIELGQLMRSYQDHLGVLATFIEKEGIHGWDKYGRFKKFRSKDDESLEALGAIAEHFEWLTSLDNETTLSRLDSVEGFCVFTRYGWHAENLPAFDKLCNSSQEDLAPPVRASSIKKAENTNTSIIGALLAYIEGDVNGHRHVRFQSEAELIKELCVKLDGFPGMSKSTLEAKFAGAKAFLGESGWFARRRKKKGS